MEYLISSSIFYGISTNGYSKKIKKKLGTIGINTGILGYRIFISSDVQRTMAYGIWNMDEGGIWNQQTNVFRSPYDLNIIVLLAFVDVNPQNVVTGMPNAAHKKPTGNTLLCQQGQCKHVTMYPTGSHSIRPSRVNQRRYDVQP